MNLIFLIHFVLQRVAFGLVIGSPNLPVLDDGDVSGIFEIVQKHSMKIILSGTFRSNCKYQKQ